MIRNLLLISLFLCVTGCNKTSYNSKTHIIKQFDGSKLIGEWALSSEPNVGNGFCWFKSNDTLYTISGTIQIIAK